MPGNKKPSIDDRHGKRFRFVILTIEGKLPAEISTELGISVTTIYRWYAKPGIKRDIDRALGACYDANGRKIGHYVSKAIEKTAYLMEKGTTEAIQLAAAKVFIDHLGRLMELKAKVNPEGFAEATADVTWDELLAEGRQILDRRNAILPEPGTFTQEPIDVDSSPVEPPVEPPADDEPEEGPSNGHGGNGKPPGPPSNGKH